MNRTRAVAAVAKTSWRKLRAGFFQHIYIVIIV